MLEVVDKLPLCPSELRKKRPALYKSLFPAGGAPVECPFCQAELEALTNAIPMRSTSKMLAGATPPPTSAQCASQDCCFDLVFLLFAPFPSRPCCAHLCFVYLFLFLVPASTSRR